MNKYKNLLPVYLKGLVAGKYTLAQAAASCGYSPCWIIKAAAVFLQIKRPRRLKIKSWRFILRPRIRELILNIFANV